MSDLSDDENRLLASFREAKTHGFSELHITIHEHCMTDLTVTRKERFRLPPTRLRETTS